MRKLTNSSIVKVNNKEINISEVLTLVTNLLAEEMLTFFTQAGITFPRQIRISALRTSLNPYVKDELLMEQKLTDEENYRLRWYEGYSEHQLVNLLHAINVNQLFINFKEELWLEILSYLFEHGISEESLNELFHQANKLRTITLTAADSLNYNNTINALFFDEANTIDGLKPGIFRPVLYKCSTLVEIREIGRKYNVNVPRRLKKAELVEIIKDELKDRGELTAELEEQINKMNVISLQRFAINNEIKASIELKKEEIIEYILKNAEQTTKEYFKPSAFSAYEVIEGLEHLEEEPEPVEMVEEIEPVVEEVERFIVYFELDHEEGVAPKIQIIETNNQVIEPKDPVREDYKFLGWHLDDELYDFDQQVTSNLKLVAKWELTDLEPEIVEVVEENITIVFDLGYENLFEIKPQTVLKGSLLKKPEAPVREGFEFVNWFLGEEEFDFNEVVNHDITLVAHWHELELELEIEEVIEEVINKIFVSFELGYEEGINPETQVIDAGSTVVKPIEPTRKGFNFLSWMLSGEEFNFNEPLITDVVLVANWEKIIEAVEVPLEKIIEHTIVKEVIEVKEEKEQIINANSYNILFPYVVPSKTKSLKKGLKRSVRKIEREELMTSKEKEQELRGAIKVRVVE